MRRRLRGVGDICRAAGLLQLPACSAMCVCVCVCKLCVRSCRLLYSVHPFIVLLGPRGYHDPWPMFGDHS